MSTDSYRFEALPRLAVAIGATTPNPGKVGALCYSTTLGAVLVWSGLTSSWQLPGDVARSELELTPQTATPAALTGTPRLYVQKVANRDMLGLQSAPQAGHDRSPDLYDQAFWNVQKRWWIANNNSATPSLNGLANNATSASTTNDQHSITYVSSTLAGSSAGTRHGANIVNLYNNASTAGPIETLYTARFRLPTSGTERVFVGLSNATAALTNQDPSANTNLMGLLKDAADTNLSFFYRGAGTGTKYAIAGAPIFSSFQLRIIDLAIWYPRMTAGSEYIAMSVRWSGISGTLPLWRMGEWSHQVVTLGAAPNVAVGPQIWVNNGTSATARNVQVFQQYMEQS